MDSQCRSCLASTADCEYMELSASFDGEKSYLDCFIECTQLQVNIVDDLPRVICKNCVRALQEAYNFIKIAHKSEALLIGLNNKLQAYNEHFAKAEIDNMEIVVLETFSEEIPKGANLLEDFKNDNYYGYDTEKNYSEDDADYLLEPSISDSQWACLECRRLLDECVSYEAHMNIHRNLRPYKCTQCKTKGYRCQKALDLHIRLRHNKKRVNCNLSQCNFSTQTKLEEHTQSENNEVQNKIGFIAFVTCNQCSKMFESKEAYDLHLLIYHNPTSNTNCTLCSKSIKNIFDLNEHLCTEHPIEYSKLFQDISTNVEDNHNDCEAKKDTTESEDNSSNIGKKLLRCNMAKQLALHTTEDPEFLCTFCPRRLKNKKSLRQHEKIHETSEDVTYPCADCNRQYNTSSLLEQHRKNSHKEREYVCSICGNAFKLKNQLKNHMKLHLEKNIQCPHCDKKYARRFDLNVHIRSHTGEMPFECHLCEKKFAIKVRLTYHLQKHYGIKHSCKECGAEFNSRQKLKAHTFKHTGMPYRCEICDGHGFPNRDVFKRHLLRVHHATICEEDLLEMFRRNTGKSTRICEINVSSD